MNRQPPSSQHVEPTEWVTLHTTPDEWEARLIRAALVNERIRCRLQFRHLPSGGSEYVLAVQQQDYAEATDLVDHVIHVIESPEPEEDVVESPSPEPTPKPIREVPVPKASPTAYESVVIASREGIGEIVHHIGRGFELRVGPPPYYIVEESRWEEFTDFSAQRQEFAILLRAEYTNLFQWIKENKLMAEFIRLVESTYRDVPPPRRRRAVGRSGELSVNLFAVMSFGISLLSLFAVFTVMPWFITLSLGLIALAFGFIGRYQIGTREGKQRGTWLAILGVGIACVVIAMSLVNRQSTEVSHHLQNPSSFMSSSG